MYSLFIAVLLVYTQKNFIRGEAAQAGKRLKPRYHLNQG